LLALSLLAGCNRSDEPEEGKAVTVDVPRAVVAGQEGVTPMAERIAVIGLLNKRQTARMAMMYSRIRAAGDDQGIEKRLVMCGLICDPSPRMKRPFDAVWRSLAVTAVVIGLRAKATAMPVPSSTRAVSRDASRRGRNGSWLVSAVQRPS
jgi:hypothetical protein